MSIAIEVCRAPELESSHCPPFTSHPTLDGGALAPSVPIH